MTSASILLQWKVRILAVLNAPPLAGRPVLLFEHGTDGATQVDAGCTDHAHIHAIPVPDRDGPVTSAAKAIEELGAAVGPIIAFEDLAALAGEDYFWIADRDLRLHMIVPERSERQYLRRVVADAIGRPDYQTWDAFDEAGARATMDAWRTALAPARGKA